MVFTGAVLCNHMAWREGLGLAAEGLDPGNEGRIVWRGVFSFAGEGSGESEVRSIYAVRVSLTVVML